MSRAAKFLTAVVVSTAALAGLRAEAAVVDVADVVIKGNAYEAFMDTQSGLTWLDLDNFWDNATTYYDVEALVQGTTFAIATRSDLDALFVSMTADPNTFASDVAIVGGNYLGNPHPGTDRDLIWGAYDDGLGGASTAYAWRWGYDTVWNDQQQIHNKSATLSSANPDNQDMGIWVVGTAAPVPVPAALPLMLSALAGLGFLGRRRRDEA